MLADSFARRELATVSADDVLEVLDVARSTANQVLRRMANKGWLLRVRRGLYSLVPLGAGSTSVALEDPWKLAAALYSPGYISGWSAAEHWDLTEQIFNTISVVTSVSQRNRSQVHGGVEFLVVTLPPEKLFGTKKIWRGSTRVEVADPSRLIIDILGHEALGAGARHTLDIVRNYWGSPHASPDLLLEYAERYGVGAVFKRLGFTAERFGDVSSAWTARCKEGMSAGLSDLDPSGPKRGRTVTQWRLRLNVPLETR